METLYQILSDIAKIFQFDFVIGYLIFSTLCLVASSIPGLRKHTNTYSYYANQTMFWLGCLFIPTFICLNIPFYQYTNKSFIIAYTILIGIWISIFFEFKRNKLSRYYIIKLIYSLILIFDFERYVIIITSLHRDGPSSSFSNFTEIFKQIAIIDIATGLLLKTIIFSLLLFVVKFIIELKQKKKHNQ